MQPRLTTIRTAPPIAFQRGSSLHGTETRFATPTAVDIANAQLTSVALDVEPGGSRHVARADRGGIRFLTPGWYEILLRVEWANVNRVGTRFSHTKIPGRQPLHSEAIDAGVLAALSQGAQLLRGSSVFGPGLEDEMELAAWQDSGETVRVNHAELIVRELCVPWPP